MKRLYRARLGLRGLDSARQNQIEAAEGSSLNERDHCWNSKASEKDRYGEVAASPNLSNMAKRGIRAAIILICLLCIGFAVPSSSLRHCAVVAALKQIPPDEKWFLDYFFRELILKEGGAYVLYGSKPAALGDFCYPTLEQLAFYGNRFFSKHVLMKKGLAVWRKYQHLFPSANYHILFCENKNDDLLCLVFVNKKTFLKAVADHIDDFKAVFGNETTPSRVYSQLVGGMLVGNSFLEALEGHSGLLGMLLGYGRYNSLLFHQRDLLIDQMNNCVMDPTKNDLVQNVINQINNQLRGSKLKSQLLFSSLPRFVYDDTHPETNELFKGYRRERKELTAFYGHGDFLEITLKKLTSG